MNWYRDHKIEVLIGVAIVLIIAAVAIPIIINGPADYTGSAEVMQLDYQPPRTTTSYTKVGDVSVPTTTHHPEEYNVFVAFYDEKRQKDRQRWYDIDEHTFHDINVGDEVFVDGRVVKKAR